MDNTQIIILVIVSIIAATLAVAMIGSKKSNWLLNFMVALVGGFLGHWVQNRMGFPSIVPITIDHISYEFIWTLLGALLFIFLVQLSRGSDV